MATYYLSSGEIWKEHLENIAKEVKKSGRIIHHDISDQTRQIVASNEALNRKFGEGFDELKGTLDWSFNRVEGALTDVGTTIESLRADFNYGIGLVLTQLGVQNRLLADILDRLDAIHETLKTPMLTKARELYRIGCNQLSKGLLDKALEFLHKSEEVYDADFFTQFQLGKLYLYGKDEDDDVIDLGKAEKHLRLAIRYGKPEINQVSEMSRWVGEAFLHASIACYAQAGDFQIAGKIQESQEEIKEAADLAKETIETYPQLSEGYYYHAKFSALLGDSNRAITSLERAILADRNYCIKVDIDRDFDNIRPHIYSLIENLREKARQNALEQLQEIKRLLSDFVYISEVATKAQRQIEQWSWEARVALNRGTYFDYLDTLSTLYKAQKTFFESRDHIISRETYEEQKRLEKSIEDKCETIKNRGDKLCDKLKGLSNSIDRDISKLNEQRDLLKGPIYYSFLEIIVGICTLFIGFIGSEIINRKRRKANEEKIKHLEVSLESQERRKKEIDDKISSIYNRSRNIPEAKGSPPWAINSLDSIIQTLEQEEKEVNNLIAEYRERKQLDTEKKNGGFLKNLLLGGNGEN